ncbi:MAG: hypothetical protein WCA10_10830 [Terracidiphilus sp.]
MLIKPAGANTPPIEFDQIGLKYDIPIEAEALWQKAGAGFRSFGRHIPNELSGDLWITSLHTVGTAQS